MPDLFDVLTFAQSHGIACEEAEHIIAADCADEGEEGEE